ncbi:MAG: hypothetical protein ABIJ08_04420 [Nanoarchaeota archaeon]
MKDKINIKKGKYLFCFLLISLFLPALSLAETFRDLTPTIVEQRVNIDYSTISDKNITKELALNAILQAEEDIAEMESNGWGVSWPKDQLLEAKKYLEVDDYAILLVQARKISDLEQRKKAIDLLTAAQAKSGKVDYDAVLTHTKNINDRRLKAYEISDFIKITELRISDIESTGLDLSLVSLLLSDAKKEFDGERYNEAISMLQQIEPKIVDIQADNTLAKTIYRMGRENTLNFIMDNYIAIIISLVIFTAIFLFSYNRFMIFKLNTKIDDMKMEHKVLKDLIKRAQMDYYSEGKITKKTYETKLAKHKDRILQIKEQTPVLRSRLNRLRKFKRFI